MFNHYFVVYMYSVDDYIHWSIKFATRFFFVFFRQLLLNVCNCIQLLWWSVHWSALFFCSFDCLSAFVSFFFLVLFYLIFCCCIILIIVGLMMLFCSDSRRTLYILIDSKIQNQSQKKPNQKTENKTIVKLKYTKLNEIKIKLLYGSNWYYDITIVGF